MAKTGLVALFLAVAFAVTGMFRAPTAWAAERAFTPGASDYIEAVPDELLVDIRGAGPPTYHYVSGTENATPGHYTLQDNGQCHAGGCHWYTEQYYWFAYIRENWNCKTYTGGGNYPYCTKETWTPCCTKTPCGNSIDCSSGCGSQMDCTTNYTIACLSTDYISLPWCGP